MTIAEAGIEPIEGINRAPKIIYINPDNQNGIWNLAIRQTFRERGYTEVLATPGMPLETGPSIFGLGVYTEEMWRGTKQDLPGLYESVAEVADVKMPERYRTVRDLQGASLPLMVKSPSKHRGEGKILVESEDGRKRVIALVLAYEKIQNILSAKSPRHTNLSSEIRSVLQETLALVNERDLQEEELRVEIPQDFVAQKFIETPGDNYASLRIVVDATGCPVYSAVFYTPKYKGRRLFNLKKKLSFEEALRGAANNNTSIDFLLSEESPVYVKSRSTTSNVSRGGKKFVLGEGPARDKSLRKTLRLIGIDPDTPEVPETLLKKAGIVGKEFRMAAPFVGEDFMFDQDGNVKLLEVNTYPGITSFVGHKPGIYTEYDGYKYIVRKMLERAEQENNIQ